jgi:hypothetical protein
MTLFLRTTSSNGYICIRRPLVDGRLESRVSVYDVM